MKPLVLLSLVCALFAASAFAADAAPAPPPARPKLVDLGASTCIPCRLMIPVLAELTKEYAGQLDVEFVDVWKTQGAGERYGIRLIPTQIFYDATGNELFRHDGFLAKKDILAKWKELGINLKEPAAPRET